VVKLGLPLGLSVIFCLCVGANPAEISWPPCASAPFRVLSPPSTAAVDDSASVSLPSRVEPCAIKPGLTLEWINSAGARWVETFMGYHDDPNPACVAKPPCSEWREDGDNGTWFYFYDGDRNLYHSYRTRCGVPCIAQIAGQPSPAPDPQHRFAKRLRWPLTIGDEWTNDYGSGPGIRREVRVVGWEKVRVPAGTFQVIHIRLHNNVIRDRRLSYGQDLYYEPDIGIFVKIYFGGFPQARTSELTAIRNSI